MNAPRPGMDMPKSASAVSDKRRRVVWFVNQYAGSPAHGMEFRHYELARELVALGHTVVVISGSFSHLFARQPITRGTYTLEHVDGVTYCWVRIPAYRQAMSVGRVLNMLAFMARLYRLPYSRLPRPDAIVVSSPSLFPILPSERWARRAGSRLVFEVRDVWPLTLQELGGLSWWHPLVAVMGWFEAHAYRVADVVVSVLPAAGPHMVTRGMDPSKLRIIPNGAAPDALLEPVTQAPPRVREATRMHAFNVGFVGTLGFANALETMIDAARILADDDVGFVIVGRGSEEARLRESAAGLPNVTFVGEVPRSEVAATLREFDVCYVGYRRSPLYRFGISPNKVFDYLAASQPIILAADGATEWLRSAGAVTVPADDAQTVADAVRALRALPDSERRALGEQGRAFVEREHTYERLAARYAEVLGEAAR